MVRMFDVGSKLLNGIKCMDIDSIICGRVEWGESESFRTDSGEKQGWIMSPWINGYWILGIWMP